MGKVKAVVWKIKHIINDLHLRIILLSGGWRSIIYRSNFVDWLVVKPGWPRHQPYWTRYS